MLLLIEYFNHLQFFTHFHYFLRTLQAVQIGANIKILDSPGIVMENPVLKNNTLLCLKNLVKTDQLSDATLAAQAILFRSTKQQVNRYT